MLRVGPSLRGAAGVPYSVAQSAVAVSTTGDTTENTLATITIPGGAMGANGVVRITSVFSYTTSANVKTLKVKFGGTAYQSTTVTATASVRYQSQIQNRNSVSSQVGGHTAGLFSTSTIAPVTSSVDTSSDVTILITGQNGLSSETITLESYLVEVIYNS